MSQKEIETNVTKKVVAKLERIQRVLNIEQLGVLGGTDPAFQNHFYVEFASLSFGQMELISKFAEILEIVPTNTRLNPIHSLDKLRIRVLIKLMENRL